MALIVRSRRAASAAKSSVNSTSAWRPSQATSRRSVVISKCRPFAIVLTVPWARPVGIAGRPARSSSRITCSGRSGVARSISAPTGRPNRPSRTQPPTNRASRPSASQGRENPAAGRRAQPSLRRERACGACGHPPGARNDKRVLLVAVIVRPQAVVGIGMRSFRIASRPSGRRKRRDHPWHTFLSACERYRTVVPGTISPSSTCGGM